jgi:hypothetical protein
MLALTHSSHSSKHTHTHTHSLTHQRHTRMAETGRKRGNKRSSGVRRPSCPTSAHPPSKPAVHAPNDTHSPSPLCLSHPAPSSPHRARLMTVREFGTGLYHRVLIQEPRGQIVSLSATAHTARTLARGCGCVWWVVCEGSRCCQVASKTVASTCAAVWCNIESLVSAELCEEDVSRFDLRAPTCTVLSSWSQCICE